MDIPMKFYSIITLLLPRFIKMLYASTENFTWVLVHNPASRSSQQGSWWHNLVPVRCTATSSPGVHLGYFSLSDNNNVKLNSVTPCRGLNSIHQRDKRVYLLKLQVPFILINCLIQCVIKALKQEIKTVLAVWSEPEIESYIVVQSKMQFLNYIDSFRI